MTREDAAARPDQDSAPLPSSVRLRPAVLSDAPILFRWRNDPETRRWSFSHDEVSWTEHVAWLRRMLGDPLIALCVAEDGDGLPVAAGRLTSQSEGADTAELHVAVDPSRHGAGIGTTVIAALSRRAQAYGLRWLTARILEQNTGSRTAFSRAGFQVEEQKDGVVTMGRRAGP